MARRKPKGIDDDIVSGIRKIMWPWSGAPPGQNESVTQAQGLARSAAETLDQMFAGGMIKAGVQGNKALVKQAAINAAALGTGYIAGKAAVTAAGAIKSGRVVNPVAAVRNFVKGEKVVVHGSPQLNLQKLNPTYGSGDLPNKKVLFSWDTNKRGIADRITRAAGTYASRDESKTGAIYIARIKKSDVDTPKSFSNLGQVISKSPAKVVQEIPIADKSFAQLDAELKLKLRQLGAPAAKSSSRSSQALDKTKTKINQTFQTKEQKDAAARRKKIR